MAMRSPAGRFWRAIGFVAVLSMLSVAAVGSASGAEWRQFHMDAAHRGFNASESTLGLTNAADIELRWSGELSGQPYLSSPVIANGRVFIGTWPTGPTPGGVRAFDQGTGALLWHREQANWGVVSSPAVVDGRVFILSSDIDGNVSTVAYRAWNGDELWTVGTGGPMSGPVVKDGVVYVGGRRGLFALDAVTGEQRWFADWPGLESPPTVVGDRVYVAGGAEQRRVAAFAASTGARIWTRWISPVQLSSPVVVGNRIYVGTSGDGIYCLFARRGVVAWHRSAGRYMDSTPAVDGSKVYINDYGTNRIVAYDAITGAFAWASHGGASQGSVSVANGVVWGAGLDGMLVGVDAATGTVLVSKPLVGESYSSPAIVDGVVYVGANRPDNSGVLMAFGLPN
jgi:eukaryotic-like serine/threonine-protein kinase